MPRIKKFNRTYKFHGNMYTKPRVGYQQNEDPRPSSSVETPPGSVRPILANKKQSSSSKKLKQSKLPSHFESDNVNNVNIIFNLDLLVKLVSGFTKCKFCDSEGTVSLKLDQEYKNGLTHKVEIECTNCRLSHTGLSSNIVRNLSEVNTRFVYALRSIGCGIAAGKMFTAIMNLAPPNTKVQTHIKRLLKGSAEVSEASMRNAATEAVEENHGSDEIAAAFDGSWQKRGHTSLNGVITVTSFDTGKVLDYECLAKFCVGCVNKSNSGNPEKLEAHKVKCSANYKGSSGGMEVVGAKRLCARSWDKLRVKYAKYLGDGDSKGYVSVLESKPYGESVQIEKLECVGHVQKRLGTRLRKLKKNFKGKKLSDNKGIGGTGRLTDDKIDQLQRYYGLAIRKNLTSVDDMKNAIWATYFHTLSTDDKPQHHLCPKGKDSWCGFNKAVEEQTTYKHTNSLAEPIMLAIKPIYEDLTDVGLLRRCLHGKTQNPNESFNSCIWQRVKKTGFVGLRTLQLGVSDAVIAFNEGSIAKANVLDRIGINPGKFTLETLRTIDNIRIQKADKEAQEGNKKKRVKRRLLKRKREDEDTGDYCPGGF